MFILPVGNSTVFIFKVKFVRNEMILLKNFPVVSKEGEVMIYVCLLRLKERSFGTGEISGE